MVKVKICGVTCLADALAAARLGADALGFVFAPSPRQVTPEEARRITAKLPPLVLRVGVFVDEEPAVIDQVRRLCGLDVVQLHGNESTQVVAELGGRVIKAIRVNGTAPSWQLIFPSATLLLDTFSPDKKGGTGRTFDWSLAREPARLRPVVLAGGLTPQNVAEAVRTVRPYAVDVSSGVESEPGRKNHETLARFIRRAKSVG